ncbi:MAG: hypothetical protein AAGH87_02675 [Pseudomonadota bacterium]
MFDRADLQSAVREGVIDEAAAARLEAHIAERRGADAARDGESLRFLANFNDIFISIGIVLLLSGLLALCGRFLTSGDAMPSAGAFLGAFLPAIAAAWLLSEYFCARRRLLLPSIVLCTAVCVLVGVLGSALFGEQAIREMDDVAISSSFRALGNLGLVGAGSVAAAALAYFARFRLPFSLFVLALGMAGMTYAGVAFFGDAGLLVGGMLSLLIGLVTLGAAIWLDTGDPQRLSRRSDFGFWLHLAAAPQIILGLRGVTVGFFGQGESLASAALLLVSLLGFAYLSLALNRRALIVSSLLTYGIALTALIGELGLSMVNTTIFTLILLGGAVVLIGGGWSAARRLVLATLPRGPLLRRIFPDEPGPLAPA